MGWQGYVVAIQRTWQWWDWDSPDSSTMKACCLSYSSKGGEMSLNGVQVTYEVTLNGVKQAAASKGDTVLNLRLKLSFQSCWQLQCSTFLCTCRKPCETCHTELSILGAFWIIQQRCHHVLSLIVMIYSENCCSSDLWLFSLPKKTETHGHARTLPWTQSNALCQTNVKGFLRNTRGYSFVSMLRSSSCSWAFFRCVSGGCIVLLAGCCRWGMTLVLGSVLGL